VNIDELAQLITNENKTTTRNSMWSSFIMPTGWFANILLFIPRLIIGWCPQHGWGYRCKKYRMNTAYLKEEDNYSYGCDICKQECDAYYKERWDEYYSGIM